MEGNLSKHFAVFADFTEDAVFVVKILVQTEMLQLEMGTGAGVAGEQAVAVTAIRPAEVLQRFLHVFQNTALMQRQLFGKLHMVTYKQTCCFRTVAASAQTGNNAFDDIRVSASCQRFVEIEGIQKIIILDNLNHGILAGTAGQNEGAVYIPH